MRLFLLFMFVTLFIWLIALYVIVKVAFAATNALFVRGEGRQIYGGSSPLLRRNTVYRSVARTIDYFLIAAVVMIGVFAAQTFTWMQSSGIAGGGIVLGLLYFPLLSYFGGGTTPGKTLFGLEVTSTVGQRSLPQLAIREVVFLLSLAFPPLALYVVMKNEDEEQAGDVIANTLVVKSGSGGVAGLSRFVTDLQPSLGSVGFGVPSPESGETVLQDAGGNEETTLQTQSGTQSQAGASASGTDGSGTEVYDSYACDACNSPCPEDSAYCPHCGAEL